MASEAPTIVFFPEGAFGPTNNCAGIADVLKRRGARVVFVVEESFAGTLAARGFEEALMRLKPKPAVEEEPGQFWKDFIRDTAPQFRKTTFEKLETLIKPIWAELIDGSVYVNDRLSEIFASLQPDVIVQDNVVAFPAVVSAGVPWVRIVSCNPLEMKDPALPPTFSGLPCADRSEWDRFRRRYHELHAGMHRGFNAFVRDHGCPPLPGAAPNDDVGLEFIHESPYLNLYIYPADADYARATPLAPAWHRLESCVRATDAAFVLPAHLRGPGKLIYLSLGSLGSADTELMSRLIDLLGRTRYRVVVSMGPQQGQIVLPANMYGEEVLPQPSILPLADLVITHGGNNTVTECFHNGKPMVALPLFWDQHENAQRVHEMGFGVRLAPYTFTDDEFYGAVEQLLADEPLHARMRGIAARLQSQPGTMQAATLIEQVARQKRPAQ